MLIDLKYHLVSLVAVFLALAVGILVGSSFLAGSSVEKRVALRLEKQFKQLVDENKGQHQAIAQLTDRLKKQEDFERGALPLLIDGQLAWRRIAIIQTGDYSEAAQSAKRVLESAGATVVSVTTIANLSTRQASNSATSAIGQITGDLSGQDAVGKVIRLVAESIVSGSKPEVISAFQQKGLITTVGEYDRRVLAIVLVGGCRSSNDCRPLTMDLPLIDALTANGATTIAGCEPVGAVTSCISNYSKKSIPTVDNVDTPMGQVALVYAILGESGNFGIKDSANRVLPVYFESGQWRYRYRR